MEATARLIALRQRQRRTGQASFFYYDYGFNTEAVKVLPGEYFVYDEDIVLMTVLGSCVAACLCDRGVGVGGMNHFLLPDGGDSSARYGVNAMEILINELLKNGARRSSLEAKIFGGGAVIQGLTSIDVGGQNVKFVEAFLASERIPIVSRDVLSNCARKVCLFPRSGKAMVKKLATQSDPTLIAQERSYLRSVQTTGSRAGEVELF
ncbi:MAG TPA: chemoreceptor glutamine deamidase CheD [Burkholderiaceae bacterium]|nr:chemoreceptor glutamine deamidase CheD [Burkholderiaceae bacterium]